MKQNLRVHCFQHAIYDGAISSHDYLLRHGAHITTTEFFALPQDAEIEIDALPLPTDVDLLMVMGSQLNVEDEANLPWLKIEKRWIRRYLAANKPLIGLGAGGQLVASALGSAVVKPQDRIGPNWVKVHGVNGLPSHCFQVPPSIDVMSWYGGETFDIPKGAIHLAMSNDSANQAYQLKNNILGFQFCPEMTPEHLNRYLEEHQNSAEDYLTQFDYQSLLAKESFLRNNDLLVKAIEFVLR
ncbi:type 1 glutamine amidotransferase [Acinetobacter apis]|uniref:GMP synthase - Glutamine amidotransferase n=1 Tax=Acinetobacter apis TaxID=1229165 RepID=A0A217EGU8_9GAMM|nr:type 1 glutamine amidotransferase [Acinetobacter apis]SNQ29406.1 GMP synthase - Glutamine amidotransferase [Acinetobacter apis]